MGRLHHKCNRLPLRSLTTCSITITNTQNNNVMDYDYIESNRDYIRDYICFETSLERKQNAFARFDVSIFSNSIQHESCNKRNYLSVKFKHRKKNREMFVQSTKQCR